MAQKPGSSTSRGPKGSALAIGSWALYDFANTIFSATCITLWFPIYLESISGRVIDIGRANVLSMIAAGILLPVAGAVIDRTGRAKPWLFWLTVICCAATALLGAIGPPRDASHGQIRMYVFYLMTMFVVANFAYQVSLVFYNSLLTAVAPKRSVGFVSGLGVGLGYAGIIFALLVIKVAVESWGVSHSFVFVLTAVLFMLFALPLFVFVKERRVESPEPFRLHTAWDALRKVWRTDRSLRKRKGLLYFFLGNFLVVDALNTAIVYFGVYISCVFGYRPTEIIPYLLGLYTGAFIWGVIQGKMCDRLGAKPVYLASAGALIVTVVFCAVLTSVMWFFVVLIAAGSFALAGVWTAGRKMLVDLSPPGALGAYFGLYGMTGRLSAYGTIFFALIADALGFRMALMALMVTSVPGLVLLSLARKEPEREGEQ